MRIAVAGKGTRLRLTLPPMISNPWSSKLVKFQQRYQMRNRILSKAVPALEFYSFCDSQKCVPLVRQFWGFDSDRILQLFV